VGLAVKADDFRNGSWLCENAVLVAQRASGFNLVIELKNIILRRVSIFEFSHSQGQSRPFDRALTASALPSKADLIGVRRHISKVPLPEVRQRYSLKELGHRLPGFSISPYFFAPDGGADI
jgi:hypothetical protein